LDIQYQFSRLLALTQRRWTIYLDKRLSALGLTHARWLTLVEISKAETKLNQRELASRLGIESATLVNLLDGLAASHLIRRIPDATDRRTKRIEITPAGNALLKKISAVAEDIRHELLEGVSERELQTMIKILRRIHDRVDKITTE